MQYCTSLIKRRNILKTREILPELSVNIIRTWVLLACQSVILREIIAQNYRTAYWRYSELDQSDFSSHESPATYQSLSMFTTARRPKKLPQEKIRKEVDVDHNVYVFGVLWRLCYFLRRRLRTCPGEKARAWRQRASGNSWPHSMIIVLHNRGGSGRTVEALLTVSANKRKRPTRERDKWGWRKK